MDDSGLRHWLTELRQRGVRSPHLDRLESRFRTLRAAPSLEQELLSEMASSLRRAEDKILIALLRVEEVRHEIDTARARCESASSVRALERTFNTRRSEAAERIRDLAIQREAIGLRRGEPLERVYGLPPPIPMARD